jgi:hypothetical protein
VIGFVRELERMPEPSWLRQAVIGVPVEYGPLPDGRPGLIIGAVRAAIAFNHVQGENAVHFRGDCGVVCCVDVLDQFGVYSSEDDVVRHAVARGELHFDMGRPDESGWTYPGEQARILCDYGVPAHAEQASSIEWLAEVVQRGHGAIIGVNGGVLWNNPRNLGTGEANRDHRHRHRSRRLRWRAARVLHQRQRHGAVGAVPQLPPHDHRVPPHRRLLRHHRPSGPPARRSPVGA